MIVLSKRLVFNLFSFVFLLHVLSILKLKVLKFGVYCSFINGWEFLHLFVNSLQQVFLMTCFKNRLHAIWHRYIWGKKGKNHQTVPKVISKSDNLWKCYVDIFCLTHTIVTFLWRVWTWVQFPSSWLCDNTLTQPVILTGVGI